MCLCLMGALFANVPNKFKDENHITEIVFPWFWGNFGVGAISNQLQKP